MSSETLTAPNGFKPSDLTTLIGKFGSVSGAATFVGKGGLSARAGFLFALSLVPGVMLALGLLEVLSHYGALKAAQKLMTPQFGGPSY